MYLIRRFVLVASMLLTSFAISAQTFVSTTPGNRNVLIEEYTGVSCQYCPLGHKAIDFTLKSFPGRAFAINIHQGVFASQFSTQWGNALANQASVQGYPSSTLNRHAFSGGTIQIDPGQSYPCALQMMDKPAPVNVAATVDIDPVTRLMVVKVEVYYPGNGPGDFNMLNVALVQNNVLGNQTGGSQFYPENMVNGQYRHMHILRHLLTGQWGDTIYNVSAGSFFTKEYAYVVPQQIGDLAIDNMDNLSVVVFVCQDRKEVLNVCEAIRKSDKAYIAYGAEGGYECSLDYHPYVSVVNPTDKPVSDLRFEINGTSVVRHKTIAPYTSDTVQVVSYSIADMPASHQQYGETVNVRLTGYTTDGSQVNVSGNALSVDYANVDVYTAEGPLTLSIKYDSYPQEVTFSLAGLADCQYYYRVTGTSNDEGKTVNYTLSPATAGLYRLKLVDVGADGLNGTVTVTDAAHNTLFSRSARDLMVWDNYYFNITTPGTDGPIGTVVGIEEPDTQTAEWNVWPNPVSDVLHISDGPEIRRVDVLDLSGRVQATSTGREVNVSALPAGLYILRVVTAEGVMAKKIVKLKQ